MSSEKVPVSLKDYIKRDITTLKGLKGKAKLRFLWDYYKLPFALLLIICLVVGVTAHMLYEGQKPCRLRICAVLNNEMDCSPWFDSFVEELKSDGKSGDVDLNLDQPFDYDNQYYYIQEMEVMTTISSYRMDVAICNPDLYSYLLALNACMTLDTALPADLYNSLKAEGRIDHTLANLQIDEYGEVHPEDGIEGDYGIILNGTDFANTYNVPEDGDHEEPLYAVIISNTDHLDDCVTLIRQLTK
ncbi:MAG: hypothetical protein KBS83_07105 [Lachnospiraceae bacterium]|nr:hypothetical protein [Candidatus Equihabitans merdae]